MANKIVSIFKFLESSLGMHPATVAANALLIALLLAILAVFLFLKLKSARKIIKLLGKRLGYEPPFGDGAEIFDEENRKDIVDRGREKKVELLEQQLEELKAEEQNKDSNLKALQQRAKELEDRLQQASEQAQAHQKAVEQLEQRMRDMQTESDANAAAARQRSKELEEQLQQAILWGNKITALGNDQAQAHQKAVEQFEQRMRDMEAVKIADLTASQRRLKDLEEQLMQATLQNEKITLQAGEQVHTHQIIVEQLEQRVAEGSTKLTSLQERSMELEEQVQLAAIRQDRITAEAAEQVQAYRVTVNNLEQRMREIEFESSTKQAAHQQRLKELEDQLRQATDGHQTVRAQAEEQAQAHRTTVEQFEQRMREMEAESVAYAASLDARTKELEDQLRQATDEHQTVRAQAEEQARAHRTTVEQLEQRMRAIEANSAADLDGLRQQSKELEEQLLQANLRYESEKSSWRQESLERNARMEQLAQQIRDMETNKDAGEFRIRTLQGRVKELEDQLQQSAGQMTVEKAKVAVNASEQFLRRAEWITACAVGTILPHGLVAAEAYASAALAANPQSLDAAQLLAELARIRRAYPEGLPSVAEAVTTFDERAAAFFAADPSRAAEIAEDEAQRRYRAGLNRSAFLAVNVALDLRQPTDAENGPATLRLQEMKSSLLARLGNNARTSNAAPRVVS